MRAFCPHAPLRPSRRHATPVLTSRRPFSMSSASPTPRGKIVCPGKFDSFHLGHLALARAAAEMGRPVMLSFSGMAETLGWAPRAPVVAPVERDGILRAWAADVGKTVAYKELGFVEIRDLEPEEFVDMLVRDGAKGIVCGSDWRFGVGAKGDVGMLREIAEGMDDFDVRVVEKVVLETGIVSSTAVREAIAEGEVGKAKTMMGRAHRLVGLLEEGEKGEVFVDAIINQVPTDGNYQALIRVPGRREPVRSFLDIKRPEGANPRERGDVNVRVTEGELLFCSGCEVYIDLEERVC